MQVTAEQFNEGLRIAQLQNLSQLARLRTQVQQVSQLTLRGNGWKQAICIFKRMQGVPTTPLPDYNCEPYCFPDHLTFKQVLTDAQLESLMDNASEGFQGSLVSRAAMRTWTIGQFFSNLSALIQEHGAIWTQLLTTSRSEQVLNHHQPFGQLQAALDFIDAESLVYPPTTHSPSASPSYTLPSNLRTPVHHHSYQHVILFHDPNAPVLTRPHSGFTAFNVLTAAIQQVSVDQLRVALRAGAELVTTEQAARQARLGRQLRANLGTTSYEGNFTSDSDSEGLGGMSD